MYEPPAWHLGLSPFVSTGFIQAYDQVRNPEDPLAIEDPDPPFAAWLVRRGRLTITRFKGEKKGGPPLIARENHWLFLSTRPRAYRMLPGTHLLSVRMTLEYSPGIALFLPQKSRPFCLPERKVPHLRALASRLVENSSPGGGQNFLSAANELSGSHDVLLAEIAFRSAYLSWIEAYLRIVQSHGWHTAREITPASPVDKVFSWIRQQGFASPLKQSDLAEVSGLSLSHLKRLCQREAACSPIAYWQSRRLNKARQLLRGTRRPLKEISSDLGFRFASHFSVWFRNRSGISPLEFRQKQIFDV
jgi:AraC-like DNA-binding protein